MLYIRFSECIMGGANMTGENDSIYRGVAELGDFYFKSPIAKLGDNEDEYSRCWVYLSEKVKNNLKSSLEQLNSSQ